MARKKKRKPIDTTRGSVTKLPTKDGDPEKWQIRVYHGVDPKTKKRVYRSKTTLGTKDDAIRLKEMMLARTRTRRAREGGSSITLQDLGELWLAEKELQVEFGKIKQITRDRYASVFHKHVAPCWGDYVAINLHGEDIATGIKGFLTRHEHGEKEMALLTVEQIRSILYQIIHFGLKKEMIDRNPLIGIDLKITRSTGNQSTDRMSMDKENLVAPEREAKKFVLTREQQVSFLIEAEREIEYALWLLMLHTGMRIGEACALSWDDIYEDHVHVRATLTHLNISEGKGKWAVSQPKTMKSTREIEISPSMHRVLLEHRKREMRRQVELPSWEYPNFVFHTVRGSVFTPRSATKKITMLYRKIGLEEFGGRTHVLRHTHATFTLWDSPGSLMALSKRLGHSNPHITMQVYAHAMPESQEAILTASDKSLFGT